MNQYQDISISIPHKMDLEMIRKWKNGELLKEYVGTYKRGRWTICIYNYTYCYTTISVYGFNGMRFGEFNLDNGWVRDDIYYPTLTFYNRFSITESGYIYDILSSKVDFGKEDNYTLTLDAMVKAIDESWDKIKDFLNK